MLSFVPLILASMQAAAVPPAPSVAAKPTQQQAFDAASKARTDGRCAEAITGFETIEANRARRKDARKDGVDGVIAVRKGACLVLASRWDEGEVALRAGLAVLTPLGDAYRADIYDARMTLARLAFVRLDYATAEVEAKQVLAMTQESERIEALMLLARIQMFDEGDAAIDHAAEVIALIRQHKLDDKTSMAAANTIHARALLVKGRNAEAYAELREALKLQGGLSLKVTLGDIVTRSDLAIAASLAGDREAARKYLAYTGAGRTPESPFTVAASLETPSCAGDTGLSPDDSAIVEFSLRDDGSVASATPIYTTGGRGVALQFAQAVTRWSWQPEDAAKIPPFFRAVTRVEMRCSTVAERPGILAMLRAKAWTWLEGAGLHPITADTEVRSMAAARAALARLGAGGGLPRVPALIELGTNRTVPEDEQLTSLTEARALLAAAQAPTPVQTYVAIPALSLPVNGKRRDDRTYIVELRHLLASPAVTADAASAATLRLLIAQGGYRRPAPEDAPALLAAVVADDRLAADDPLKINALLQQASRAAATGDLAGAGTLFARTGLNEQQCALIGAEPRLERSGGGSHLYPTDALQMGFQGWLRMEFDVQADGKPAQMRAVVAYPPFLFNRAGEGVVAGARYASSYRPSGGTACTGMQRRVVFRM